MAVRIAGVVTTDLPQSVVYDTKADKGIGVINLASQASLPVFAGR